MLPIHLTDRFVNAPLFIYHNKKIILQDQIIQRIYKQDQRYHLYL